MTSQFDSITQYDKQFDDLFQNPAKKGFSCSFFSLLTAWKFLNGEMPDNNSHTLSISQSLFLQSNYDVDFGMTFEELLSSFTDINPTNIYATTAELINSGELGFNQMFSPITDNTKVATVILKNERYLTVLADKNGYYFRDCHESVQYNFKTFDELVAHLINSYQFTENVNAGGIEYSEYSSIEFLTLNAKFYFSSVEMLGITNKNEETTLFQDELYCLEMVEQDLKHENLEQNLSGDNLNDNLNNENNDIANEMCYMKMLESEINGDITNLENFDIMLNNFEDYSENNDNNIDVNDIEEQNDDYVDFN